MKKSHFAIVLLLILTMALAACAASAPPSGGGAPAPSGSSNTNANANAQPTAAPQPPPASNENGNSNASSNQSLDITDVTQGLDTLNSYKSTFTVSYEGTENGQPKNSSFTFDEEFSKEPLAKHTTWSSTGTDAQASAGGFEMWEVDGKSYMKTGDSCMTTGSSEPPTSSGLSPSAVIGDIQGAQPVGTETVNGMQTVHYKVDLARYAALGISNASAEAWVSSDGYVVKYTFQGTGKDLYFGTGGASEGTLRYDYELSNINQPLTITPPDNCGGAGADIPILPDATDQAAFADTTTYRSATAFSEAVDFYKTQMVAQGWTEDANAGMSAEGFATLSFKKDTRTASITITTDSSSGTTSVLISVSGGQ
jgi:hypothetical protein